MLEGSVLNISGSVNKKINNSYGIILDDLLAGLYTIITIMIIYEYFKWIQFEYTWRIKG